MTNVPFGSSQLPLRRQRRLRAFTLVELMVALTGGLFVSIVVFAMARQGTRFYQQESRIAEATLAATLGMQRLRADIGRAGYMASASINTDPSLCTDRSTLTGFLQLQKLQSLNVVQDKAIAANTDLTSKSIVPDQIILAGAYQSADRFIAGYLPPPSAQPNADISIPLQPNIGALVRYRYSAGNATTQAALLRALFPPDRVLRLVNQYGKVAYGIIRDTATNGGPTNNLPAIILKGTPAIPLRGDASNVCVFAGVGVEVNVVNFIRYRIADLRLDPLLKSQYGLLYRSAANPWDIHRTELVREELDPSTGAPVTQLDTGTGTQVTVLPEIVAEYAVDLKFEVTAIDTTAAAPKLQTTPLAGNVYAITMNDATGTPQRVRSVRARLSVRSREADRSADIPGTGLYRLGITASDGRTAYARVRTLQADIAIPNHFGAN
jgi:type II secretory pathway pseudopilin PulG